MSYVALYRVWRPARWEDVVDQKAVVRILKNALREGKVSHAYVFSGPRGTGKTTVARLLAKAVNCQALRESEPCNKCRSCLSIGEGSSVDVIEIDAASNRGIDEMRSLRESVRYVPVMGRFKVYIIDEVHMLTQEAFNALLKTLEEPPEHVIFVMATTAPHKIPLTITSRCQRLDFRRLAIPDIEGQMEKILTSLAKESSPGALPLAGDIIGEVKWEKNALRMIARAARGSMRDALSILDLCLTYGGGSVREEDVREILGETPAESMMRLFRAVSQRDVKTLLGVTQEASDRGKDMGELCEEISEFARDLLLVRSGGKPGDIGRPQDEVSEMTTLAKTFSPALLISVLDAASRAAVEVRNQDDPRLVLEMCLLGLFLGEAAEAGASIKASLLFPAVSQVVSQAASQASSPSPANAPLGQETPQAGAPVSTKDEAPALSPSDDELIETVKASWPRLLEGLSQGKRVMARAYLMPASPSRIEGGNKLVLAYPRKYGTHMEQIMVPENKAVVERYLHRLVKRELDIKVEVSELGTNGGYGNGAGDDQGGSGAQGMSFGGNGNGGQDGNGKQGSIDRQSDNSDGRSSNDLHPLVKAAITMVDGKVVS